MNDYKELVAKCDEWIEKVDNIGADNLANHISACADAIEQLVKERDNIIGVANKLGKRCGACDICGADCPISHNRDYLPGNCEYWELGIERSETDVR